MNRGNSDRCYYFPDDYCGRLVKGLESKLKLVQLIQGGGVVGAAGLFFEWPPLAHLDLTGAAPSAARECAGNLLHDGVTRWASARGLQAVHVREGLRLGDSLSYACVPALFSEPRQTRDSIDWTSEALERVLSIIKNFDFLAGYERQLPSQN